MSKRVRVDAAIHSDSVLQQNQTTSIWIDLIFRTKEQQQLNVLSLTDLVKYENKFQINSNNLLNLFNNGDEFQLTLNIDENYNHSDFLNIRKYQ